MFASHMPRLPDSRPASERLPRRSWAKYERSTQMLGSDDEFLVGLAEELFDGRRRA